MGHVRNLALSLLFLLSSSLEAFFPGGASGRKREEVRCDHMWAPKKS